MPIDEFIIKIYLMVDDYYKKIVTNRLRQGGYYIGIFKYNKNLERNQVNTQILPIYFNPTLNPL